MLQKCRHGVQGATLINERPDCLNVQFGRSFYPRGTGRIFAAMQPHRLTPLAVQLAAWVGLWVVVFLILGDGAYAWGRWLRRSFPLLVGIAAVVTINHLLLLPSLYFRGHRLWFVLGGGALVLGISLLLQYGLMPDRAFPLDFGRGDRPRARGLATLRFLLPLATSFLGSSLIEVTRYAFYQEKRAIQAQREQVTTELKFLKSQVNPHFLFNTLNNIYTLTLLKDEQAPGSLLQLSGMLRYMLYEAEAATVPLRREIAYIRDFVQLQALKDSRGQNVRVDLDESRPDLPIAPLLLIPFVENAFKHSHLEGPLGFIDVQLRTTAREIVLLVNNSLPTGPVTADRQGGIGLDNVRKRLALLYPERHTLAIERTATTHTVTLKLQLP
ncbi:hypothetical protein LEM8419_02296 [Neolewinella maritima]|uniref:Signal transduction histidine kinase internal region domain-containing protein n=1 Tax=Neolewinella maritima TaxID=1383882 RepID=A0ABN8FA84_9BACT|nr:histidine kinase [Neolewinella maritima]CAH1001393.1 hypothetical protein LEM8419_02296 [Neolewinella maritima]